jgi:hypothetical protein
MKHTATVIVLLCAISGLIPAERTARAADKEAPRIVPVTPVAPGLHFSRLFNDHMVLQREAREDHANWA